MTNTALITGASSGIGLELAKIHASKGGNLILVARSESKLNNLKTELENQYGIQVTVIALDLSQPSSAQALFEQTPEFNSEMRHSLISSGHCHFFENNHWLLEP